MSLPSTDPIASVSPPNSPSLSSVEELEVPQVERIDQAQEAFKNAKGEVSLNKIARQHGIAASTLHYRVTQGGGTTKEFNQRRQRLSPEEETALKNYICRLQAWGWPGRVEHIRMMAQELCKAKGDTNKLGINWNQKFLRRHPDIKSKYIPPLDKERALAEDPTIIRHWFELFHRLKQEHNVCDQDIYNMDEKGFMQGCIGKYRVMISKYEKKEHMTQLGNREWVTTIECVSVVGKLIRPYIIFKAAIHKKAWFNAFPEANIAISENGWTDNEIGLLWLQHFAKESAALQKGQYRILILDGHASHITTAAIKFAVCNHIILLCLPPHTTHLLQPLDVGLFAPLATAYRQNIHSITRLGASYSIDKIDFLEQYQKARESAFTVLNIQKAWEKTGLIPYNPSIILQGIPEPPAPQSSAVEQYTITIRPTTPPEGILNYSGPNGSSQTPLTPANTLHVQALLRRAHAEEDLGTMILKKVGKAAILAMADATIQEQTNQELMALNRRKENKKNREKGNITNGNARVLNQELLDDTAATKAWNKEWSFQIRISPHIFEESQAATKRRQKALQNLQQSQKAQPYDERINRAPKRSTRLIVRLRVRVTTQELEQGRWAIKIGAGGAEEEDLMEDLDQLQAMGRGQRVRKPRRAS